MANVMDLNQWLDDIDEAVVHLSTERGFKEITGWTAHMDA